MNIFRFYSEKEELIENNLTRALAICLKHDPVFACSFFSEILDGISINPKELPVTYLQSRVKSLKEVAGIDNIYPVSINATQLFSEDEYEKAVADADGADNPQPDLIFQHENNLIVCEVKLDDESCLGQLKHQVETARNKLTVESGQEIEIKCYKSLTWQNIIGLLEGAKESDKLQPHLFVEDFYKLLLEIHTDWFPVKTLNDIVIKDNRSQVGKRLEVIIATINKEYPDHSEDWIPTQKEWARQFEIWLDGVGDNDHIYIACWPGYTKGQGWHMYRDRYDTLEWLSWHKKKVKFDGLVGEVDISPCIRVAPWIGKDIGNCAIDVETAKELFTKKNFELHTGKKDRGPDEWEKLNKELNDFIGKQWKEWHKDNWSKLISTNYNSIYISMATCFYIKFKYDEISKIDKSDDGREIVKFFKKVMEEMRKIVSENKPPPPTIS